MPSSRKGAAIRCRRSLRTTRESVGRVIVFDEAHLRRLLRECVCYHHDDRTHLGLAKEMPTSPRCSSRFRGSAACITDMSGGKRRSCAAYPAHFPAGDPTSRPAAERRHGPTDVPVPNDAGVAIAEVPATADPPEPALPSADGVVANDRRRGCGRHPPQSGSSEPATRAGPEAQGPDREAVPGRRLPIVVRRADGRAGPTAASMRRHERSARWRGSEGRSARNLLRVEADPSGARVSSPTSAPLEEGRESWPR